MIVKLLYLKKLFFNLFHSNIENKQISLYIYISIHNPFPYAQQAKTINIPKEL